MKVLLFLLVLTLGLMLSGNCKPPKNRKPTNYDAGRLTCYSEGKIIYDGCIQQESIWAVYYDGAYRFIDKKTGQLMTLTGDCVHNAKVCRLYEKAPK